MPWKNYHGNDSGASSRRSAQCRSNSGAETRIAFTVIYLFTPPHTPYTATDHIARLLPTGATDRWTIPIKIVRELSRDLFKRPPEWVCCISLSFSLSLSLSLSLSFFLSFFGYPRERNEAAPSPTTMVVAQNRDCQRFASKAHDSINHALGMIVPENALRKIPISRRETIKARSDSQSAER